MTFTISSAYAWPNKDNLNTRNNSEKAVKRISEMIKNRFNGRNHNNEISYRIDYKRLRASAGRTMLDSIIRRIKTSNVVIFDLTHYNRNVLIELGIALHFSKINEEFSFYLIKEKSDEKCVIDDLPSDLQGFFISEYVLEKNKIVFKDNNSLRMSIESDVKDFYNKLNVQIETIDEINFDSTED
jgi:hypothetical protein